MPTATPVRWTHYLQEAGARARSQGRPRETDLQGEELARWREGYDAMDAVVRAQLEEIQSGWLAAGQERSQAACPSTSTPGSTPTYTSKTGTPASGTPSGTS